MENGIGESVQINCTTRCQCESTGEYSCTTQPCTYDGPTALAETDPHYDTFDLLEYDYMGFCEYVLTKPCDSDEFVISAKNRPCGNGAVSCVNFVRIAILNENLEIILERVNAFEL